MRIFGMHIPPGYLRWAAACAGVLVLGVLIATTVSVAGLFGGAEPDRGRTVQAKVVTGASCADATAREKIAFTLDGKQQQANYDGCGHAKDEPVTVTVPPGPITPNLTVHAADAAVGEGGEGLGLLLIVVSGVAGAGYAFLLRRGPRTRPLPPILRLSH